jgi:hypothetical protein
VEEEHSQLLHPQIFISPLAMEKRVFDELVTFLRSPERVLKLTGKPRETPR